jgi:hypothetical protein
MKPDVIVSGRPSKRIVGGHTQSWIPLFADMMMEGPRPVALG